MKMGASCCSMRDEYEDLTAENSADYRNCMFLRFFLRDFVHMGREQHALASSSPVAPSVIPMVSLDNSVVNVFRPPPQPLPYDADPRYLGLQLDGQVSGRDKGSSHSYEEAEAFTASEVDAQPEHLSIKNKWTQVACEEDPKDDYLKSSFTLSTIKSAEGFLPYLHFFRR